MLFRRPREGPSPAQEVAALFFDKWLKSDSAKAFRKCRARYKSLSTIQRTRLEQKLFIYTVANLAVALTNESSRRQQASQVIPHLRVLTEAETASRWGISPDDVTRAVEEAGQELARLLFTNPELEKGLAIEWGQRWFQQLGVEEFNPVTLWAFSHSWKLNHVFMAKALSDLPEDQFSESA